MTTERKEKITIATIKIVFFSLNNKIYETGMLIKLVENFLNLVRL